MLCGVVHAYRVAGDGELRAEYVALGELSLAGPAAGHAERPAVFGAQVGESGERSGLLPVSLPQNPQSPRPPRFKRCECPRAYLPEDIQRSHKARSDGFWRVYRPTWWIGRQFRR